jgi:hypothetical protein
VQTILPTGTAIHPVSLPVAPPPTIPDDRHVRGPEDEPPFNPADDRRVRRRAFRAQLLGALGILLVVGFAAVTVGRAWLRSLPSLAWPASLLRREQPLMPTPLGPRDEPVLPAPSQEPPAVVPPPEAMRPVQESAPPAEPALVPKEALPAEQAVPAVRAPAEPRRSPRGAAREPTDSLRVRPEPAPEPAPPETTTPEELPAPPAIDPASPLAPPAGEAPAEPPPPSVDESRVPTDEGRHVFDGA